jgi:hypothetical protein
MLAMSDTYNVKNCTVDKAPTGMPLSTLSHFCNLGLKPRLVRLREGSMLRS